MGALESLVKIALKSMNLNPDVFIAQAQTFVTSSYNQLQAFDARLTEVERKMTEMHTMIAEIHATMKMDRPMIEVDKKNAA